MISLTRPKLLLLVLIFSIAFIPFGQINADGTGSMDTMMDNCTGCELANNISEADCDVDSNCLQCDCVSSFAPIKTGFISSIHAYLNPRLILGPDNQVEPIFQSHSPESLYRPPIT